MYRRRTSGDGNSHLGFCYNFESLISKLQKINTNVLSYLIWYQINIYMWIYCLQPNNNIRVSQCVKYKELTWIIIVFFREFILELYMKWLLNEMILTKILFKESRTYTQLSTALVSPSSYSVTKCFLFRLLNCLLWTYLEFLLLKVLNHHLCRK